MDEVAQYHCQNSSLFTRGCLFMHLMYSGTQYILAWNQRKYAISLIEVTQQKCATAVSRLLLAVVFIYSCRPFFDKVNFCLGYSLHFSIDSIHKQRLSGLCIGILDRYLANAPKIGLQQSMGGERERYLEGLWQNGLRILIVRGWRSSRRRVFWQRGTR